MKLTPDTLKALRRFWAWHELPEEPPEELPEGTPPGKTGVTRSLFASATLRFFVRSLDLRVRYVEEASALFVECVLTPVSPTEPLHVIHIGSVPVKS